MTEKVWIKVHLAKNGLTQRWLLIELAQRGILADETEVSVAISGKRNTAKSKTIRDTCIAILKEYEAKK